MNQESRPPEVTLMTWSSALRHRRPKTFAIGLIATAVVLALTWLAFAEVGYVVLAALFMGGALGPLYFSTRFRFTDKKVYQRIFFADESHRWADFESYDVFGEGVYLRLRPSDLRLRYLKGLTVYFGPKNREEVLQHLHQLIQPSGETDVREAQTPADEVEPLDPGGLSESSRQKAGS